MKIFYAIALAFLSVSTFAGRNTFSVGDGKVPDFDKYKRLKASMRFHVKEVRTDYDTIPGSVIHWYSDGTAETNLIRHIDLVVQTNTVERQVIELDAEAAPTRKIRNAKKNAVKKDQKNLENAIKDMKKARDKSSESMQELYQSIIDILEEADAS